ncbi:hypothetical protein AgCh_006198 [Apium graveolens]
MADNAQSEDRQLLKSEAVRGTEVQTEFDNEEEREVILLVHDIKPPFLAGRIIFTKQAEPVMPIKDPTSDMTIISRKDTALVGDDGEVDFKEDAKFARHLKKDESVSDFAKSKTLSQQC